MLHFVKNSDTDTFLSAVKNQWISVEHNELSKNYLILSTLFFLGMCFAIKFSNVCINDCHTEEEKMRSMKS